MDSAILLIGLSLASCAIAKFVFNADSQLDDYCSELVNSVFAGLPVIKVVTQTIANVNLYRMNSTRD